MPLSLKDGLADCDVYFSWHQLWKGRGNAPVDVH